MRISVEQIGGTESHLIESGSTVGTVITRVTDRPASNYAAQVNDVPASASQTLVDGDRLSIVPTKVKGASA